MDNMRVTIKCKALEKERDAALREVEQLNLKMAVFQETGDNYSVEKVEREQEQNQSDELQKEVEHLKSQLHQGTEAHTERQLRNS